MGNAESATLGRGAAAVVGYCRRGPLPSWAAAVVGCCRRATVVDPIMLTGDRLCAAQRVARAVGIKPVDMHAGLLPEDKQRPLH